MIIRDKTRLIERVAGVFPFLVCGAILRERKHIMGKKISIGVCISLIAIACTVTFVITWTISLNMYNEIIPGAVQRDVMSAKLWEIDAFVRNNYPFALNDDDLFYGVYSGYISGVGDKNTIYMTADEHAAHISQERGQLVSCGIRAEKEESGYIKVAEVYRDSDAEANGILKGDLITDVNGVNVQQVGAEAALMLIPGEENTTLSVTIQRDGELKEYSLVRQSIDIISVETEITESALGIIRISTFNDLTASQFEAALKKFAEEEVKAMVIDLRENNSGFFKSVSGMVNCLVKANSATGIIASTVHKGGERALVVVDESMTLPEEMQKIPIAILVDSTTSGAAELFTVLLQSEYSGKVWLIGEPTAGNTLIQQTQLLSDGSAIRVTVARITLASGFEYGEGLVFNNVVEFGIDDQQMQTAFVQIETELNIG